MFNLCSKIKGVLASKNIGIKEDYTTVASNRTKKFQETADSILNRIDKSVHKDKLDELSAILNSAEKDISTLSSRLIEIDKMFKELTSIVEKDTEDKIISLEVNEYRFKYGDLLVCLIEDSDKKFEEIKGEKEKEVKEKSLMASFVTYASRFDNLRARLTDEASDRYVKIISKYSDEDTSMIPKEFEV